MLERKAGRKKKMKNNKKKGKIKVVNNLLGEELVYL